MYLTVKQQVKHLSKEDYKSIKQLCHIAKNLTNQAIYNVRQYYFNEGEYLNYEKNYALLKSSENYKMLLNGLLFSAKERCSPPMISSCLSNPLQLY